MEFLYEYGLFLAKVITFVVAVVVIVAFVVAASIKPKVSNKGQISIEPLNERFDDMKDALLQAVLSEKELKDFDKEEKKSAKKKAKEDKKKTDDERRKRVFVLDFDGDIKASAVDELRETITAVLTVAQPSDEVVIKLESGGGMVHSYGLASSQLARITQKSIPLTVCVDKVAASGGYMMACVANKILAAPFAVIGSIGVVAQLPNFNKILKKHDIDYEMLTAGKYKRTLTMLGENTDEGRQKFLLRSTYEPVLASVAPGARVRRGTVLGSLTSGHESCSSTCLHWGIRRGRDYLDPTALVRASPIRLKPLDDEGR
ncbi:MAG: protease SohB [Marinagarivorans sp.]|nr:protease SohB [Marinagarivorans sp.]